MNHSSKFILVSGATGGIGQAVCKKLARSNEPILIVARNMDKLKSLESELLKLGATDVVSIPVDMTSDSSVANFAEEMAARNIELKGVVVMPPQQPPTNNCFPANDAWTKLFQESFIGPLSLLKVSVARMKPNLEQNERCKVVIISGISSAQVLGHYATSNVLRLAWLGEAKTLAFALGDQGIHVNTVSLGGTMTEGYAAGVQRRATSANMTLDERIADETSNIPLRKFGRPEEVAVVVESLLGGFSDHITGVNLLHDGGFTKGY